MSPATPTVEQWATTVIEQNGADLFRYLLRRDSQDFEDMLNETLAIIWKRRHHLPREPVEARMWSFGVARNIARRQHRRRAKHAESERSLDASAIGTASTTQVADPAYIAETNERDAAVYSALHTLKEPDRELIMLVHWDDFTITDAAALISINPSTARTRYARAKQRLAAQLAQHSPVAPAQGEAAGGRDPGGDRLRYKPNVDPSAT